VTFRGRIGLAIVGLLVSAITASAAAILAMPPISTSKASWTSPYVLAEDGRMLRLYLAKDTRWRMATTTADVPRHYIDMLVAYEDRRFYEHSGIDVLAMARAAWQLMSERRVVSGASTLTMQVARLLEPAGRGMRGKIIEMIRALEIEWKLSKREILNLYLTLAPFGSNIEGVRAASLIYFGKEPRELDDLEAALLIAISQRPEQRRPDRHPKAAQEARNRVLARAAAAGVIGRDQLAQADKPVAADRGRPPMHASHLADRLRRNQTSPAPIYTDVDLDLQQHLEQIAGNGLDKWPREMNVAFLVIRNRDCAVRAYVGGADYLSRDFAGQFDHVRGIRSPGSTLKPLIYGLAFEDLIVHPYTVTTDGPVAFDGYAPRNFNAGYQGDMTVREALIKSINTTAVSLLARVGPARLTTRLRSAGIPIATSVTDLSAGLAIALGGAGTSLENLTLLYTGIARDGLVCQPDVLAGPDSASPKRVLSSAAAWAVADILADAPPPPGFSLRHAKDGGRRIAYKTGTSYGFRDAWAIGFDQDHTVGVWAGRSDGAPTMGATGAEVAAPLLYRIFDLLPDAERDVAARRPADSILAQRGPLPDRLQRLVASPDATASGSRVRILYPRDNATLVLTQDADRSDAVTLMATGGVPPYFWFVNDKSLNAADQQARWSPTGTGQATATVMDSSGEQSEVKFWVRLTGRSVVDLVHR
jgi:penicillin-binding protein 1C